MSDASKRTRLAIVGDVHEQWYQGDVQSVKALQPDMTLFVGDLGNEALEVVRDVAALDVPKSVVLGNHDAFFTRNPRNKDYGEGMQRVKAQLEMLGDDHIGFRRRDLPNKPVSIVGARPFTWGGRERNPDLIEQLYGFRGMDRYAQVIRDCVLSAPCDNAVVIVGHNGPTGLGDRRFDICGVDFRREEGDHGDIDLKTALDQLESVSRSPALVTFGHMHHRLQRSSDIRKRAVFDVEMETLFLNAAVVPRVCASIGKCHRHHFCLVGIEKGHVVDAEDVFVETRDGRATGNVRSIPLFERREQEKIVRVFDTYREEWKEMPLKCRREAVDVTEADASGESSEMH